MSQQNKGSDTVSTVALVVSALALGFSGLQYWVSRGQLTVSQNQLLLSMKPSITFETEDDVDDPPFGIKIGNAGPGPAVVKAFTYFVNRKAIGHTADAALNAAGLSEAANIIRLDLENGDTLAVGENEWLISYKVKPRGAQQWKDGQLLADLLETNRLAIEIEFCPVLGGICEKKCSTTGACG